MTTAAVDETAPRLPYPVLIADIGGTYARFAVVEAPGAEPAGVWKVETDGFPDPLTALRTYLERPGSLRVRSAFLAIAGRVDGAVPRLTNAAWRFDLDAIGRALRLDAVRLVNDYVPLAALVALLDADDPTDLVRIGPSAGVVGTRLVLGPGTGLGAAALVPAGDRHLVLTTEAGHIGFGPCRRSDDLPWSELMPEEGRLTAETLLSGPGLVRLARALAASRGGTVGWCRPAPILEAVAHDPLAAETLHRFVGLLGGFAGDLALAFGASGGVFLAGGIAPRIVDALRGEAFRAAFEDTPPFRDRMHAVPRFVIARPEPALDGLAVLLRAPERFLVPGRNWGSD